MLQRICGSYPTNDVIELLPMADELCLLRTASEVRRKRLDPAGFCGAEAGAFTKAAWTTSGPVEVPPDPVGKRVALNDTWDFSARAYAAASRQEGMPAAAARRLERECDGTAVKASLRKRLDVLLSLRPELRLCAS